MSKKFHITKDGRTAPCGATVKACPLGEANHYESLAEAVNASMGAETQSSSPANVDKYEASNDRAKKELADGEARVKAFQDKYGSTWNDYMEVRENDPNAADDYKDAVRTVKWAKHDLKLIQGAHFSAQQDREREERRRENPTRGFFGYKGS